MKFSSQTIQKILIPIDGSDYSIHAAEYGISIAKVHDAEIMVVYVIDDVVIDRFTKINERDDIEQELKNDGQGYINYIWVWLKKEALKQPL